MRLDLTPLHKLYRALRLRLGLAVFGASILPFVIQALERREPWTVVLARSYAQGVPIEQLLQKVIDAWEQSLLTGAEAPEERMH